MFNKKKMAPCMIFCGLALLGASVHASEGRTEIKSFSVQLIDTDTGDGIVPALTFGTGDVFRFAGVYNPYDIRESAAYSYGTTIEGGDTGVAVTTVLPDSQSSEATNWGESSLAFSNAVHTLAFQLTPNTLAKFSAEVIFTMDRQGGGWARGIASMFGSGGSDQYFSDELRSLGTPAVNTSTGVLYGEFLNHDFATYGELRFTTEAYANSAVPEPGTWGMLLGGLAVIGAVAGKRSGKRSEA